MEIWKPVVGYEGFYEVSSEGRVRGLKTHHGFERSEPLLMRLCLSGDPNRGRKRLTVGLRKDGRTIHRRVHRLVLEAFVGPCPFGQETRHLDDNPQNNRLENLLWGTPLENAADARRNGLIRTGERCRSSKLKEFQVREIRARLAAGEPQHSIAASYGVHQWTISAIKLGKTWGAVR